MGFHRILCPVDFSEASSAAARFAAALAHQNASELTLLHVAPAIDFGFSMAEPNQERLAELAAQRDQAVRRALEAFPAPDVAARRELVQGDAGLEIVRIAREGYDLVVMSTHGSGAIRRWLLVGSTTSKVLHASECAVIAATDFSGRSPQFRRIVCALDLGPQSRRVLCSAAGLAREPGATLMVVHATPGFGDAARDFIDGGWRSTLNTGLRERISALQRETSVEGEVLIEAGESYTVVPETAGRAGADLIVIGRGVHTGVLGRLRAQAYEIIRNAPCPVLSV